MQVNTNIGQAFPLESLGSELSRNSFNYQSILNALVEWNTTSEQTVMVRLAKDTPPWYEDMEIPSKKSVYSTGAITSTHTGALEYGMFSPGSLLDVAAYGGTYGDATDPGDILTLRTTVVDSGNSDWCVYFSPMIHDWVSGMSVRLGNYYRYAGGVYKANATAVSNIAPNGDPVVFSPYINAWVIGSAYSPDDYVLYDGSVYIATVEITKSYLVPSDGNSGFVMFASKYDSNSVYAAGNLVFHSGLMYLSLVSVSSDVVPGTSDKWRELFLLRLTDVGLIRGSRVDRVNVDTDTCAYILRSFSESGGDSSSKSLIYMQQSIRTRGSSSIYQRSTGVHSSTNYSMYPYDKSAVWNAAVPIECTDDMLSITKRQPYSASMVFDHTNQRDCRTINFINYDGPDLDQGLCIYLPVEVELSTGEISTPEDAYTYEFYFRIWPDAKYTKNGVTRDHIVNKAQIYVYNAPNVESVKLNNCSYPIAKFSMARVSNFHVFAENITIPDKPVVYRATFMYSSMNAAWTLYDYYQLPDHVFVGPVGFIDPTNPGRMDIKVDGINPDASHIGYETSALPTYVDVFSRPNLEPYRSADGKFHNRYV